MKTVERQVKLIAGTKLIHSGFEDESPSLEPSPETNWHLSRKVVGHSGGQEAQDLIEFAGRACYQSFSRPFSATRTQRGYFKNIIESGHFSVLEHSSATFYLTGVSRSFTHELIRHRHLSYSQLSQRFVDSSEPEYVIPPVLKSILDEEEKDSEGDSGSFVTERLQNATDMIEEAYEYITDTLSDIEDGLKKKQIREAARAVLPNMTATKIVVTGNMRAWRHFILMRATVHADREIRETAVEIYKQLAHLCPDIFQDFTLAIKDGYEVVSSAHGEEYH